MLTLRKSGVVAVISMAGVAAIVSGLIVFARPHSNEQVFREAWVALQIGDSRKVRLLIRANGGDPDFYAYRQVLECALLAKHGHAVEALARLDKSKITGSSSQFAQQLKAECHYWLKDFRAAEIQLLSLIREDPSNAEYHLWLGIIYYDQMKFSASALELQRALLLNPNDHRSYRLLGVMHYQTDRFPAAISYFKNALLIGGLDGQMEIVVFLAQALLFDLQHREVIDLINSVQKPTGEMLAMKAESHWGLGEEKLATQCISQAEKISPVDRRVLLFRSQLLIDTDCPAESLERLRSVLKSAPHYQRAHYLLGRAYLKLGDQERYQLEMQACQESEAFRRRLWDLWQQIIDTRPSLDVINEAEKLAQEIGEQDLANRYATIRHELLRHQSPKDSAQKDTASTSSRSFEPCE